VIAWFLMVFAIEIWRAEYARERRDFVEYVDIGGEA